MRTNRQPELEEEICPFMVDIILSENIDLPYYGILYRENTKCFLNLLSLA